MLKVIVSVLLLAFFSSVIGYQQLQATIQTPLQIADNTQFEVKKGTGFNKLCRQWQQQQWVEDCWRFQILAKLDPTLTDLKAGLYELSADSVINNIKKINQGEQVSFSFTIIEGQALRDILNALSTAPHLQNDLKREQLGEQIIGRQTHLEGWLFPDTYHYHSNDTASSLLKRAAQKMQQTLADAWQQRANDLPYDTAYEALIMASIIEKETALASER
ncbi:MAG: endolytic transglycosylase MltG, partial [Pseudoalteromonas tetraodonis]